LGKDDDSPISVELDAPQQNMDAVGTWERSPTLLQMACKIILDGEGSVEGCLISRGQKVNIPRLQSDIPDLKESWPNSLILNRQVTDFIEAVKAVRNSPLNEQNGYRSCSIVNMGLVALRFGTLTEI